MVQESLEFKFVGRDAEFKKLDSVMQNVLKGHGHTFLISGEAGIGKTRLVGELRKAISTDEVEFLTGRCLYRFESDPFLPFVDALRKYFKIKANDPDSVEKKKITETIKKASPELVQMVPIIGNILSAGVSLYVHGPGGRKKQEKIDPEQEKNRMFETISQLLISISKKKPVVLFLDDLHWADDSSLELLHYISRNSKEFPVFLIGTYRPEDVALEKSDLLDVLRRMSREDLYTEIKLQRLNQEDITAMINETYGVAAPADFTKKIFSHTEGNPFFVGEILLSLNEEGIINPESGEWPSDLPVESIQIPSKVEDVIARRIERISEDEKKVLEYASVIGEIFRFDLLQKSGETPEEALAELLEGLISKNLVYELIREDDIYRFNHALIKDYLYNNISGARIKILARKIGTALEQINKDELDEVSAELANYFKIAKEDEKTLEYSILAGDVATQKYAQDEAISHYENALNLIGPQEKNKKAEILDKLGNQFFITTEWDDSINYYNKSLNLSKELKNNDLIANAFLNLGHINRERGNWTEATNSYNECLALLEKTKNETMLADTHYGFGCIYFRDGEFDKAIKAFETSLKYSEKSKDLLQLQKTNLEFAFLYIHRGDMEKAIKHCENALEGTDYYACMAYNHIGDIYKETYQYEEAMPYYDKSMAMAKKSGFLRWVAYGYVDISEIKSKSGKPEEAIKLLDEAVKVFNKLGEMYVIVGINMMYGIAYAAKQDWSAAAKYFESSIKDWGEGKHPYYQAQTHYEYALVKKELGETAAAQQNIETAIGIYKKIGAMPKIKEMEKALTEIKTK